MLHKKSTRKVTDTIVICVARSITKKHAPDIYKTTHFHKRWAEHFRKKIGPVSYRGPYKKKTTITTAQNCSSGAQLVKFEKTLYSIVKQHNIRPELMFNVDHMKLSLTSGMKQSDNEKYITLVLRTFCNWGIITPANHICWT